MYYYYGDWVTCNCGGGGGCDCLLAGSMISMADGSTKPIESIRTGDRVLSFDESSHAFTPSSVRSIHVLPADSYFIINNTIRATRYHPFLSAGRWVDAGELKVGDALTSVDARAVKVESIQRADDTAAVYTIKVDAGTYVAEGVVVHNKEDCENYRQVCEECNPD
jgi:hypothetical protein